MSNQQDNPYASATPIIDDRTRLTFDAVIEEDDYAKLLTGRDTEWLLYTVLLALLAMTTVLLLSAVIAGLIFKGWDNVVVPVIVIGLVTAAGTVFVIRFRHPLRRARRALKRFPDLLGVARGQLTESGLAFHDGTHQHWFGPQQLLTSIVSRNGIRIRLDDESIRFLALTSGMFDHYSEQVAARLKQCWRNAASAATSSDVPAGLSLWQELNPSPDNAIAFQGTVTVQQPLRTPPVLQAARVELIVALSFLLAGLLESDFFSSWIFYSFIGLGAIGLILNGRSWWRYFRGMGVHSWNQQGWISPVELAILRHCTGVRVFLSEFDHATDHDNVIVLTSHAGASYYLARDHVQSDDEWIQIRNQCQTMVCKD